MVLPGFTHGYTKPPEEVWALSKPKDKKDLKRSPPIIRS